MLNRLCLVGRYVTLPAALFTLGCNANNDREAELAELISSKVELPDEAYDLEQYSRYYSRDENGLISAVFIVQSNNFREKVRSACLEVHSTTYPCDEPDLGVVEPGGAKWVSDREELPAQNGGGCSYIFIEYDTQLARFRTVECAGPY